MRGKCELALKVWHGIGGLKAASESVCDELARTLQMASMLRMSSILCCGSGEDYKDVEGSCYDCSVEADASKKGVDLVDIGIGVAL